MLRSAIVMALAVALYVSPASAVSFVVTAEKAGVQATTTTFTYSGTETFNAQATTGANASMATTNFTSNFGSSSSGISGAYSGVSVVAADQYGGAGGTGNYANITTGSSGTASYTITLNTTNSQGLNYFGLWASAIDSGNTVSFYNGSTLLYSYNLSNALSVLNANGSGSAYYGNPNGSGNGGQAYAYLNFYDTGGIFNKVVLSETTASSGFESDNQTVGYYSKMSGTTIVGPVPEPSTWMTMILGFGFVGLALRRSRGLRPANAL